MLKLYTYFRSSAAFRVRIALNIKGLDFEAIPVHLLRGGGEQHSPAYDEHNPAHLVPVLQDGPVTFTQSLAIIEYLEEAYPHPALLPQTPAARAGVRALALGIACDIHPINNLRVLNYLKALNIDEQSRNGWSRHWIELGFAAIERTLAKARLSGSPPTGSPTTGARTTGEFCYGAAPTLADCCLIPQVFNAQRLKCALERYPTIMRIHEHCMTLEPFQRAAPTAQSDAE